MISMPVSDQNWIAKRILHFFLALACFGRMGRSPFDMMGRGPVGPAGNFD